MNVNRRFVLKSMALSGIAGLAMGGSLRALAGTAATANDASTGGHPVVALASEGAVELAFLHGAMKASGSRLRVQRVSRELAFMLDFERQVRSSQATRIIGLLDDASATLVVAMARSAGARVQWLGQHTAEAGFTRHHLLTTELAEGCSQQLSRHLHACGAGFSLNEERHNGSMAPRQLTGPACSGNQSAQWAASIGHLLASLGARPALATPLAPATSKPVTGRFASFSIAA